MDSIAMIRRKQICRFTLRFIVSSSLLYLLINLKAVIPLTNALNQITAHATGQILAIVGIAASVKNTFISHNGFSVRIITECTALFVAVLFISFVFAYPATVKQKIRGIAIGVGALFAVNQLRIVMIFLIGLYSRELFQYSHVYIGQIVMVLLVVVAVMLWIRSTEMISAKNGLIRFLCRFLVYSSAPFLIWTFLDGPFVHLNYLLIKALLNPHGFWVSIPEPLQLYPHTFNSFSIVTFVSLSLATRIDCWKQKAKILLIGSAILCIIYFFFLLSKTLLSLNQPAATIPYISLLTINQWVLPFALWLVLARNELFVPPKIFRCPICGEEKRGLADHIKAMHGEHALNRKDVRALLAI